jgi:hypothetical protein
MAQKISAVAGRRRVIASHPVGSEVHEKPRRPDASLNRPEVFQPGVALLVV